MNAPTIPQGLVTAEEIHALYVGVGNASMSFRNWEAALNAIGYKLDRSMKCDSVARIMTGDFAGINYPTRNYGLKHIESGLSAFHVDCPRPNWGEVHELRNTAVLTPNRKWIASV